MVETKGREDRDVPAKARAAVAWGKSASTKGTRWEYLYIPQGIFDRFSGNTIEELVRTCQPVLHELLEERETMQMVLPFVTGEEVTPSAGIEEFITADALTKLPKNTAILVTQAIQLFRFYENKTDLILSPVFTPLLGPIDKCAEELVYDRLVDDIPKVQTEQRDFFEPYMAVNPSRTKYS